MLFQFHFKLNMIGQLIELSSIETKIQIYWIEIQFEWNIVLTIGYHFKTRYLFEPMLSRLSVVAIQYAHKTIDLTILETIWLQYSGRVVA